MNDLGPVDVILGVKVTKRDGECILTQSHCIEKVLRKFDHFNCKPSNTHIDPHANLVPNDGAANHQERYAKIMGSIMYVVNHTRLDLACAIGILSRLHSNPSELHMRELHRVLRWKSTLNYGLRHKCSSYVLQCYSDANWASNKESSKSTNRWVFTLGGAIVAWASKKQNFVALSSMESEYVAMSIASKEIIWFKRFLRSIPFIDPSEKSITVHCDNQAAIYNAKERTTNSKKHISMRYNFMGRLVCIAILITNQMLADPFTKPSFGDKNILNREE